MIVPEVHAENLAAGKFATEMPKLKAIHPEICYIECAMQFVVNFYHVIYAFRKFKLFYCTKNEKILCTQK